MMEKFIFRAWAPIALLGLWSPLRAAGEEIAVPATVGHGHSEQGESFNEGPRRFAHLMGDTGEVHFPCGTSHEEAQRFFDQGIGQLHGFWYFEAERSFRQVLHLDPKCRMAYWGMAMANVENESRARSILAKALPALDKAPEREQLYIRSLEAFYGEKKDDKARKEAARDLVRAYEKICAKFPDDLEAKAFLVGQIWRNSYRQGVDAGSHLAVDALAQQILAKKPNHPVHHYVIHLWDKEKAESALCSAAACGPSAHNIAHMWHMPGHIYAGLERWADSAWQQEAAVRMDHRFMIRSQIMPDQIHNYAHNSEWFCRNLNHLGRVQDAMAVSKNMIEQPRIPRSPRVSKDPAQRWEEAGSAYSLGRQRLFETLLRWEMWPQIQDLAQTSYLEPGETFEGKIRRAHLLALAALECKNWDAAKNARQALEDAEQATRQERQSAAEKAEQEAVKAGKKPEDVNKAMAEAMLPFTKKLKQVYPLEHELKFVEALARGQKEGLEDLRKALEDVPEDRLLRYDWALGKAEDVLKRVREMVKSNKDQVHPQAMLVEYLQLAGQSEAAQTEFDKLRPMAAQADLDLPIFLRLKPLAEGDWRSPKPSPADVAPRKPLAEFGPLLWMPSAMEPWHGVPPEGEALSSEQLLGRPYVLILFLGKGCAHCIQQLQAFEPKMTAFMQAGLPIHTVSTDTPEGVKATFALGKANGGFPFPIYADPSQMTFRKLGAWDDFENKPLHGTFLVDARGNVRWQHISYEPYMEADFLLKEAQRLLKLENCSDAKIAAQAP